MDWGDTARLEGAWTCDPDVIALCSASDCPAVGDRIAVGRDADERYVATWSGGTVLLHIDLDRDRDEYVTHEAVVGTLYRVRPVRPAARREAYILSLHLDPAFNPPAVRMRREPDPVVDASEPDTTRNDF